MATAISLGDANSSCQIGVNNGTAEFYLPPKRSETPPAPSAFVPFSRDEDFVERGDIPDQIHRKCAVPGSRTALVGLGGVGKSQLAIEYAYRKRKESPETWVFWVHASNAARFEQSYHDLARHLKIHGRLDPKANIFELVHDWLRDEKKGQWVLILDNVDDAGFLFGPQGTDEDGRVGKLAHEALRPLRSYLPYCQHGSILITSRSMDAVVRLVEKRDVIIVDPMNEVDAIGLLEKKLGTLSTSQKDASELATVLEYMPLAIVQAAAYISRRAPRCSVRQYLETFQKSDRKKATLLDFEGGQLRRDHDAKNSIILTWQISFDHIRQMRPSAADLLSLMSFFDRQGIPEALLYQRDDGIAPKNFVNRNDNEDSGTDCDESVDEDNTFEDDISLLRDYSFISVTESGSSFEMHRLVQLATLKWLEAHHQQERWKHQFILNLSSAFPIGQYENWVTCQALFPHVKLAAAQKPEDEKSLHAWAKLLYRAAWYAEEVGNDTEAERMSILAMKVTKKLFGEEDENTLRSMILVGDVYNHRGRPRAAELLYKQVMEIRKSKLGAGHTATLISTARLASTYRKQGRWDEAEELGRRVVETMKLKLGAAHPITLDSMGNLASIYKKQGHLYLAEELEVHILNSNKSRLRVDHPDTLASMGNLALIYWQQGRWDEAEELEVQVLESSKHRLGVDHPNTMTSMHNLARIMKRKGRYPDAIALMKDCVNLRRQILGTSHPHFISSSRALGKWEAKHARM